MGEDVIVEAAKYVFMVKSLRDLGKVLLELKKSREQIRVKRIVLIIMRMSLQVENRPLPKNLVIENLEKQGFERKHILEALEIGRDLGLFQILIDITRGSKKSLRKRPKLALQG